MLLSFYPFFGFWNNKSERNKNKKTKVVLCGARRVGGRHSLLRLDLAVP
jgi:hypothetical protein